MTAHVENTYRRRLPPEVATMLRRARMRRGWSFRRAAGRAGIAFGYLHMLEAGKRCPSVLVAYSLARALELDDEDRATLMAHAVNDAGRCWRWPGTRERERVAYRSTP